MKRIWKYAVVTLMMLAVVQMAGCRTPAPRVSGEIISFGPGTLGADAFSLELEQVFGGDETNPEALLGWVTSIAVGEDGTVYAVDYRANRLVAFDSDGTVVWRIDEVGEGPGQIRYPGELVIAGEQLWMVNQAGQRLDRFDMYGDYIATTPYRVPGYGHRRLCGSGGDILVATGVAGEWRTEFRRFKPQTAEPYEPTAPTPSLDSTVVIDAAFDVPVQLPPQMAFAATATCMRDEVLVHDAGAYRIERWSLTGELLGSFGRSDTGHKPPVLAGGREGEASIGLPTFFPNPPLRVAEGRYFNVAQWLDNHSEAQKMADAMLTGQPSPERKWRHSLDLFDRDGSLLSSIEQDGEPTIGRAAATDDEGRIYTILSEPFPQIRRYRLDLVGH